MSYLYSKLPETGVSPHIGTGGAGTTLGESLGRFWASDDRFRGVLWPLRGNGNRPDNSKL